MNEYNKDFEKCKEIILSCRTKEQILTINSLIDLFYSKYKNNKKYLKELSLSISEFNHLKNKRLYVIKQYPNCLENDICISVGNEDEPAKKCTVIGFTDFDKINQHFLPLIKYDNEENVYLCMGILLPFDENKLTDLNKLNYKERWNSCCKKHAVLN